WERIWIPLMVCLMSFLVAGIVPAVLFSAVSLQYAFRRGGDNRTWWKRSLLFVQVACTTGVVCFLLVTAQQAGYVMEADLGYRYDRVVSINLHATAPERTTLIEEVRKLPFVEEAAFSYQYPIWGYWGDPIQDEQGKLLFSCRGEYFDENYIPTMQMEIIEGRNFTEQDSPSKRIVNEEFCRKHGWTVGEAVGKTFHQGVPCEVVGVVRDFQQAGGFVLPLAVNRLLWRPVAGQASEPDTFQLSMRLQALTADNLKALDKVIKTHYPSDWEYTIVPYADRVKERFVSRDKLRNNVLLVTLVALLISLIGLVGYIGNEMARRRKEIAIRKVCGATTLQVLRLLSLNLSWIVLPAIAAGIAGAVWGGRHYLLMLETMCKPMSGWLFALGATAVVATVYLILVVRTWRTANANPIDMIKVEN
ncbi:MAG: FtsX-like permease family protein, partial [Rikenellaceae bacterium]|nr:FtsX-like permease family protein [Rikenellaceae bacterium]